MIQPNEIRIGVIVTVDNPKHHPKLKDVPLKVIGVEEKVIEGAITHSVRLEHINQKVNMFYETYSQFIKFIHPIPLTEDVLLKCKGVVKEREDDKYGRVYLISNTKYIIRIVNFGNPLKEDFGFSLEISDDKKWCSIKRIYTLHDFQNTIYQLTNQELEIEL